jgi:hypothetical protein
MLYVEYSCRKTTRKKSLTAAGVARRPPRAPRVIKKASSSLLTADYNTVFSYSVHINLVVYRLWANRILEHALQVVGDEVILDGKQSIYQDIAQRMQKGISELEAAMPDK